MRSQQAAHPMKMCNAESQAGLHLSNCNTFATFLYYHVVASHRTYTISHTENCAKQVCLVFADKR